MYFSTFRDVVMSATGCQTFEYYGSENLYCGDFRSMAYITIDNVVQDRLMFNNKDLSIYAIPSGIKNKKVYSDGDLFEITPGDIWKYIDSKTAAKWNPKVPDMLSRKNQGIIDDIVYSQILATSISVDVLTSNQDAMQATLSKLMNSLK